MISVTHEARQKLREAATVAVKAVACPYARQRPGSWSLQTSNSFRRIGMHGDGDVLCATVHPSDRHPDLSAPPGVLDYIVAAQPRVVLTLLDEIEALEGKLRDASVVCDKITYVEKRLDEMVSVLTGFGSAVAQLADPSDAEAVARARAQIDQLIASMRGVHP